MVTDSLEKGTKYEDNKLVIDEEKKKLDEGKSDEQITMEIIRSIAETISPMIKLTIDTPCNHTSGAIPILDIEAKMNYAENNRIDYEFYQKPTRNEKTILANAAMSAKDKRTILTQECIRRLRNTNVELGEEVQRKHLNRFMLTLKKSGHSTSYRKQILDSAFNGFNKMLEEDRMGTKPLFRNRKWNEKERIEIKKKKKLNWFNQNSEVVYTSVLFVPPTPQGELIKELKEREGEMNKSGKERIKFIEKSGIKMEEMLVVKDPFPVDKCTGKDLKACMVCQSTGDEKMKISCRKNNVGYGLVCNTCKEKNKEMVYEGETSRSASLRGSEHLRGYKNMDPQNVIFKHKMKEHEFESMEMKMVITGTFQDALTRQSNEAVRINSRDQKTLLNSKNEMNHPPLARVTIEKKQGYAQPKLVHNNFQNVSLRYRN